MRTTLWSLLLTAAMALPLSAQDTDRGAMGGMMETGQAMMMEVMPMEIMAMLRMGDALGLTESQREQIEMIHERAHSSVHPHAQAAMAAMGRAAEISSAAQPDWTAYRTALADAADHRILAQVASAQASAEARSVLTEEQRSNLRFGMMMMRNGASGMDGMMEGMSHERMNNGAPDQSPPR